MPLRVAGPPARNFSHGEPRGDPRAFSLCRVILLCFIVVWRAGWWNQRAYTTYKPEEKCPWAASGEPRSDDRDRGHRLSAQAARGAPARRRRCRLVAALGWAHAQPRGPVDTPAAAAGDYLKRWALPSLYNPLHSSAARSKGTHLCLLRQLAEALRSETVSPRIEHQLRCVPGSALRAPPDIIIIIY